jgi:hypothetical protein
MSACGPNGEGSIEGLEESVYTEVGMKTHALFAPILVAVSSGNPDDITTQEDPVIFNLWPPVRVTPFLNPPPGEPSMTAPSIAGTIRLSVSPEAPKPSDLVFVTISAEASGPSVMLYRTTGDKRGSEIVIDLYWSVSTSGANHTGEKHEVVEPLGTFSPGLYRVYVHSHGAIEGEASAMFHVRSPKTAADRAFGLLRNLH